MCGICGLVDYRDGSVTLGELTAMRDVVANRGPDDAGAVLFHGAEVAAHPPGPGRPDWTEGAQVGLGHRRLSIIDLSHAGHQPMADETGRYWIVLNGEIYNYLELREELIGRGCRFRSNSDTEVVLAAYAQWGEECLNRMNGMWAFAIYDRERETLFCARDRFGVKPFYYQARPGQFRFASEVKQFVRGGEPKPSLDPAVLADFLFWGFQDHREGTFIKGIRSLPGGHFLMLIREDIELGRAEPKRYWHPAPEEALGFEEAAERFRELLTDSVRLRLRSDVPVGITLSGGLDSSSITCLSAGLSRGEGSAPLKAYSATFPDPKYSEEAFARAVVERAGVERVVIEPGGPQLSKDWESFVWAMDEPFMTLSFYANWKVYQRVREQGVPVILNGQGGDELLLGYERYRVPFFIHLAKRWSFGTLLSEIAQGRAHANMSLAMQLAYTAYFSSHRLRTARRLRLLKPYLTREFFEYGRRRREHVVRGPIVRPWPDVLIQEFEHYQLQHLLHHEDRVSMHYSIEARNPFLDYRLFNFVIGQDMRVLLRNGWSKAVLREAMKGVLPESVRLRSDKMGFDTPTGRLIRENAVFFSDLLSRHAGDPYVNAAALRRDLGRESTNETVLCSALSYLGWREAFGVTG